ncbi:uncharacterized protein L201_006600 [Kwoniella dendrophila CBS 6074]|uniref:Uncharacterized protein n=1 Tax=Kwoniella dendrophila CBS 6074 TaxID=1295534 RepID=A0AAX4K3B5_9TREE
MNDPLSALTAPPPRYLLESDSSDEEGQGTYAGSSKPKIRLQNEIDVQLTGFGEQEEAEEVIIGIGQSGRYISRSIQGEQSGSIKIGARNIGSIFNVRGGKSRLILVEEGDLNGEESWQVVKALMNQVKAKKWTVITSYVPSMYIPSAREQTEKLDIPAIRILSSNSSKEPQTGTKAFDAPNYLTGIAGGLVSLASHPAFSVPEPTTVLLPLPLSSLPSSQNQTLFQITSFSTGDFPRSNKRWTEDDDEPYSAPGMGRVRGIKKGLGDVSSMYM